MPQFTVVHNISVKTSIYLLGNVYTSLHTSMNLQLSSFFKTACFSLGRLILFDWSDIISVMSQKCDMSSEMLFSCHCDFCGDLCCHIFVSLKQSLVILL